MWSFKRDILKSNQEERLIDYYYQAVHSLAHSGSDYVVYVDASNMEQTLILTREDDPANNPCELVQAKAIVRTVGAIPCTP
jgi:hypothetical protein